MRFNAVLLLLASFLPSTIAVFADDAYHNDWHHALISIPQEHTVFFHRPQSSSKASLLYALSDKLILGAVNPKDGTLVWRQSIASSNNSTIGFVRAGDKANTVFSASGGEVRGWDALDGKLVWGNEFDNGESKDLEVIDIEDSTGTKDVIVLWGDGTTNTVRRLRGDSGHVVWEHSEASGHIPLQVSSSPTHAYYVSLKAATLGGGYKIIVTTLDLPTGRQTEQNTLHSEKDIFDQDQVIFVGGNSASPIIAWTDRDRKVLKINILGSRHVETINTKQSGEEKLEKITIHAPHKVEALSHFLVHYQTATSNWAEVYHIDLVGSKLQLAYSLPKLGGQATFSTSTQDANVFFTRNTDSEVMLVSSTSHGILSRWALHTRAKPEGVFKDNSHPLHAVTEVVARPDSTYSVRSALTLSSGDWELVRNGELVWKRTEALGGAVAAVFAELGESEALARELEAEVHETILHAYVHRAKRHLSDLKRLPAWLEGIPNRLLASFQNSEPDDIKKSELRRDTFGFRKLIIVATENGRLYALDTGDFGGIVWTIAAVKLQKGSKWDVRGIHFQESTGTVQILGSHGELLVVAALTGKIVSSSRSTVSSEISSVGLVQDTKGNSWLVGATPDGLPLRPDAELLPNGKVSFIVQDKDGNVKALQPPVKGQSKDLPPVWEFTPGPGERILSLTHRPLHDPVASIGRVLGDRSVLYKYLNPNLLFITAVSDLNSKATFYLLDAVSGTVIHTATHEGVDTSRPIASALSENWLAYSFWGDATRLDRSESKSYQLVVADLYESPIPDDRGPLGSASNYSAVKPSSTTTGSILKPYVVSQAYIIPEAISSMKVTQTRQGITVRDLICYLPASNALVAIPRYSLDPRRPVGREPNAAEKEEGLVKYGPVLDFDPKWIITHKREAMGIKDIIVQPAVLESTSLVFAYGLDLFGTRIAPSMEFDKLGKGFNRLQLTGTVVALALGVAFLRPMVRRKQINARWEAPS